MSDNRIECPLCGRKPKGVAGLINHLKDVHDDRNWRVRKAKKGGNEPILDAETFTDMYDDLPDGAFFAMAEEHGLSHEDFIDEKDIKR